MHVHVHQHQGVRTTIDISDEQRAKLLNLAAQRGQKGFSGIVREALDRYLSDEDRRMQRVRVALAARGALSGDDGSELQARVIDMRGRWDDEHR